MNNLFTTSPFRPILLYSLHPITVCQILAASSPGGRFFNSISLHTSKREKLQSYLCFMDEDGEGELVYEGKKYDLKTGDVVFIDCRRAYSHSTGNSQSVGNVPGCNRYNDGSSSCDEHSTKGAASEKLWSLRWCHFTTHLCRLSTQNTVSVVVCR